MTTVSDSPSRLAHIDVLKAVGIVCVLIGHLFAPLPIRVFIYSFHMPLFFLISGFLLKFNDSIGFSLFKAFKHLIVPYILTCVVMALSDMVYNGIASDRLLNRLLMSLYSIPSNIVPGQHYGITQIGPIWFLCALFWGQIVVRIFNCIQSIVARAFIILSLAIIAIVIGYHIWLPFALLNGMVAAIFVWIGSEIKAMKMQDVLYSRMALIVSLVIWLVCIVGDYLRGLHFSISIFQFPLYGFGFAGAISATIVLLNLSKAFVNISAKPVTAILSKIGRSTLEIMCVHAVDIETIHWPNGGVLRRKSVSLQLGYY